MESNVINNRGHKIQQNGAGEKDKKLYIHKNLHIRKNINIHIDSLWRTDINFSHCDKT